jgi:hypothetical protein
MSIFLIVLRQNIWFREILSINVNRSIPDFNGLVWQTDYSTQINEVGLDRIVEKYYISAMYFFEVRGCKNYIPILSAGNIDFPSTVYEPKQLVAKIATLRRSTMVGNSLMLDQLLR